MHQDSPALRSGLTLYRTKRNKHSVKILFAALRLDAASLLPYVRTFHIQNANSKSTMFHQNNPVNDE